jgi:cobalt-zinc-cadmium efflux system outer membrane protein
MRIVAPSRPGLEGRPTASLVMPNRILIVITAAVALAHGCQSPPPAPIDAAEQLDAFKRRPDAARGIATTGRVLDLEPTSIEPSDGLSLREAEWIALVFNPSLRVARAEAGVTAARAEHAGLWPDPSIGLQFSRLIDAADNPNELFGLLWFTIPVSGRLEAEVAVRGEEHRAALAEVQSLEWSTLCDLRAAWARWSTAAGTLEGASSQRALLARADAAAAALVDLGEAGQADAAMQRATVALAQADHAQLVTDEADAAATILRLIGLPRPGISLQSGAPIGPAPRISCSDTDELERRVLDESPSIRAALVRYAVAEARLVLEVRRQYPDLQVGPGFGQQDGFEQFQLGLNIPVPILNANRGGIAEAKAQRELARAEVEALVTIATAEASEACRRLSSARERRASLEASLLPSLDLQSDRLERLVALGEVDPLQAATLASHALSARVRWQRATLDESLAAIELSRIVGPPASSNDRPAPEPLP